VDRGLRSKVVVSEVQIEEFYAAGTDVLVQALQAELERAAKDPQSTADLLAELKRQIERLRKDNLSRLEQSERVRVAHVLLATRDRETEQPLSDDQKKVKRHQIEKIRTAALAGEDFGKLVQEFSEDRNLSQTKGEYVLTREAPFVPEFKAAAFSLQPGQISDIVTTAFGYHILKVLERIPARKVELGTVKDELRTLLTEQHVQKQMPAYFRTLKKEADVQVLDPKYRIDVSKDVNPLKNE
jgi:peptidyl-prolyl cis-trans isomerase C